MADGDPWSLDRIACVYETDEGTNYRFRTLEIYQGQVALGWVAVTNPALSSMPRGYKPRVWLMWDPAAHQNRRRVVVATNAAYVAGVIGTTTLKVQNPATDVEDTFTLYAMEGERKRGQEQD